MPFLTFFRKVLTFPPNNLGDFNLLSRKKIDFPRSRTFQINSIASILYDKNNRMKEDSASNLNNNKVEKSDEDK